MLKNSSFERFATTINLIFFPCAGFTAIGDSLIASQINQLALGLSVVLTNLTDVTYRQNRWLT